MLIEIQSELQFLSTLIYISEFYTVLLFEPTLISPYSYQTVSLFGLTIISPDGLKLEFQFESRLINPLVELMPEYLTVPEDIDFELFKSRRLDDCCEEEVYNGDEVSQNSGLS